MEILDALRGLLVRIRAFVRRSETEVELDDEVRFHLEMETRKHVARGVPPAEARRRALVDFGGVERFKERTRHATSLPAMEELTRNLRFAIRRLFSSRFHTVAVIGTVALGIGATTAIFSVVDAVLLEPSPFPDPDRLVVIWETDRDSGTRREPASWPDIADFRERTRTLTGVGAMVGIDVTVLEGESPERVRGLAVTPSLLRVLDVDPLAGRLFADEEGVPAPPSQSVILGEQYWQSRFGGDSTVIGSTLSMAAGPATIVGVLPRTADLGVHQLQGRAAYGSLVSDGPVNVWLPFAPTAEAYPRSTHPFFTLARLGPSSSLSDAQAELAAIAADLERAFPENAARGVNLEAFTEVVFGPARSSLFLLLGAVSLFLFVACANVANLLLAETSERRREVALRRAFGAQSGRIGTQFLTESLLLTGIGAAAGVGLAYGGLEVLLTLAPGDLPRLDAARLDGRVLLFTSVLTGAVALLFGLLPWLQTRSMELHGSLKSAGTRGSTKGPGVRAYRSGLVVTEVALAVVLVVGAGILIRSFWELQAVDPGFRTDEVVKAEYALPDRYSDFEEVVEIQSEFLAEARRIPGVQSAALAVNHPLDAGFTNSFVIVGREAESADFPEIRTRFVSPGYPAVMGVPILAGRGLTDGDVDEGPRAIVINEAGAERYFPDGTAVGQELRFWGITWRIVGVMGDERFRGVDQATDPAVYASVWQIPFNRMNLLLRTTRDAEAVVAEAGQILRAVDPEIVVTGVEPMEAVLQGTLSRPRFLMTLLGSFAIVAVLLALIGVYGILSYAVTRRAPEVGIRLALGASQGDIFREVVADGVRLTAIGAAIGAVTALGASRVLEGMVFGVSVTDVSTYLGVVAIVLVAATLSSLMPAMRAARQDPVGLLRAE